MASQDRVKGSVSSVRKRLKDTFNRVDQTGLGAASDGSLWTQVRGAFNIVGSAASGGDNNYPIAAVKMPYSNVNIELQSISQGGSAALWVSDSGNWWAVGVDTVKQEVCQTCYTCNAYSSNCNGTMNASNCISGTYYPSTCNGNISYVGSNCASYYSCGTTNYYTTNCLGSYYFCYTYCGAANARYGYCNSYVTNCATNYYYYSCTYSTYVPGSCCGSYNAAYYVCNGSYNSAYFVCNGGYNASNCNGNMNMTCISESPYSCNCSFIYPKYVRLIKSVASTISEVSSWALASAANSLRVKTSGTQLTIQAYSDQNLVTQIGSDIVYSPSNVTIETMFGISVKPSNHDQGYSIGDVTISKN
jgi:hypothetical protein